MSEYIGQILYIKPTMIVSMPEYDTPRNKYTEERLKNQENLKKNKHNNKLSDKAIKRIKNAINWLVASAKEKKVYNNTTKKNFNFKVNLITLTLPDTTKAISEKELKSKLMHNFLVYLKKYYFLKNYVWKIEFQKNGKLHIHLTTDTFISHHVIRSVWNNILEKNGHLEDFKKKFKHNNPNSTDVHAVWKVQNLGAYLAKYMSKNEQNTDILNGRIWGCNYELSDKNKCVVGINRDECHIAMKCLMNKEIDYKEIVTQNKLTKIISRTAEVFFIKQEQWKSIINGIIKETYDKHRFKIRNAITQYNLSIT